MTALPAVLLPGAVLPAGLAYAGLLAELGGTVDAIAKDLEVYGTDAPPLHYSLDTEVDGVLADAESRRWDRFHLVGYSAGGVVALAFIARHPERLLSVALLEPAWAGSWGWSPEHRELWARYAELEQLAPDQLAPDQLLGAFMRLQVRPDVTLPSPPTGPPPPWMGLRPAGIRALLSAFRSYELSPGTLSRFAGPVYFALGGRSNPVQFAEGADRLGAVFRDFTLEVFSARHHFDPPHRVEPARLASSLRAHWLRAEALTGSG